MIKPFDGNTNPPTVLQRALDTGEIAIVIDATTPGVIVPYQHARNKRLGLKLSRRYDRPEIKITPSNLLATLSFGGVRFPCVIPWDAFLNLRLPNGNVVFFPRDVPAHAGGPTVDEFFGLMREGPAAVEAPRPADPPAIRTKGHLRLIVSN